MKWFSVAIFLAALVSALLALYGGSIEIDDNIDTFTQQLAEQGRWVFWAAIANVLATAFTGIGLWVNRK